jgi:uncharacterized ubiquitin-like protein YukD
VIIIEKIKKTHKFFKNILNHFLNHLKIKPKDNDKINIKIINKNKEIQKEKTLLQMFFI